MEPNVISKHKYLALINVLALVVVLIALLGLSYASLMQTIRAFDTWADPTLQIGLYLPILLGVLFQYGQNAALYLRKRFGSDRILQDGFPEWLTTNNIAISIFIICAIVDGATNILWFEKNVIVEVSSNILIYRVIGWLGMAMLVFVEEVLGWVLDGLTLSWKELKSIIATEKRITTSSTSSYKPTSRPVSKGNDDDEEECKQVGFRSRPVRKYSETKAHILGKINEHGEKE